MQHWWPGAARQRGTRRLVLIVHKSEGRTRAVADRSQATRGERALTLRSCQPRAPARTRLKLTQRSTESPGRSLLQQSIFVHRFEIVWEVPRVIVRHAKDCKVSQVVSHAKLGSCVSSSHAKSESLRLGSTAAEACLPPVCEHGPVTAPSCSFSTEAHKVGVIIADVVCLAVIGIIPLVDSFDDVVDFFRGISAPPDCRQSPCKPRFVPPRLKVTSRARAGYSTPTRRWLSFSHSMVSAWPSARAKAPGLLRESFPRV